MARWWWRHHCCLQDWSLPFGMMSESVALPGFSGSLVYSVLGIILKGWGPASCDDLCCKGMIPQVDLMLVGESRQEERDLKGLLQPSLFCTLWDGYQYVCFFWDNWQDHWLVTPHKQGIKTFIRKQISGIMLETLNSLMHFPKEFLLWLDWSEPTLVC